MANQIVLKKSSVASKVPLLTDLTYGELALNYADGKLYFKDSSNVINSFESSASDILAKIKTVDGSGSGLDADTLDGYDGSYYLNYRNLTNKPFSYSTTAPSLPEAGDKWVNANTGIEYTYINDGDTSQWVDLSSNSSGAPIFVQSAAPNYSGGPYMWIQTGIGGTGITFWIEDGQ